MKKIYSLLSLFAVLIFFSSCNDEWKDEQFEHYVSLKAPIGSGGVTPIYVRYKANDKANYKLPLVVSGSTDNNKNMTVHIAVDPDTLKILNYERFQNREDFYYKELTSQYYSIPETVNIKSGENTSLMDIDFSLKGIDLVDKWVLPLTILDDPSYNYVANPRKHYKKALLQVNPFNDYSGTYGATTLKIYILDKTVNEEGKIEYVQGSAIVRNTLPLHVVDENTVFFYAGLVEQENMDRKNYKIYATFNPELNSLKLSSDNPKIMFTETRDASFTIIETMDDVRPYLLHRYLTINNIGYEFVDYTSVPGEEIRYRVTGSITMERKINTQIPDEDQAIEW